jgi:hypothetical protein
MTTLDDLVAIASVGTSRKPVSLGGADGALGEALRTIDAAESAQAKLLGAVAVLAQYEACGRLPKPATATPEPAADETRPACSRRAADILGQLLAMTNTATKDRLLAEWLDHAARADRRAPWRLLPALLDYGGARRARRDAIAHAAAARGAWLMRQNPRWQYAAGEQEDPGALWQTGTRDQRLAAIARLRQADPATARDLIASTWKEDAADDRAAFVASMATALSPADEPFLESALDDRSKQVRAAAADLLARLPESGLVRRMIERGEPLIQLKPAGKGGLLRKGTPAAIEVKLPPDRFEPAWGRDGVVEKPEARTGRRQWWLQQMLAAIPPAHWSSKWNLTPQECVAATAKNEFEDVLLQSWQIAAGRNPDPAWITALLLAAAKEGRGPLTLELLVHLPADARHAITAEVLESPKLDLQQLIALLQQAPHELDRHSAAALFRRIEKEVEQTSRAAYSYVVGYALVEAASRVPPSFHDELAARWTGDTWEQNRKARDEFLRVLHLRRDMQCEFKAN